ncbi:MULTISPECIES: AAA family ATPase [unclassified Halobacteriovorax]|uniref:AAA family ATPase n=1 Tax=unclassified Halobacteriovorax TaxID=2639665 RepID=UPI00399B70EB
MSNRFINLIELTEPGKYPAPPWLVQGLINRKELILMSAAAKVGKTFFCLVLAIALAKAQRFLNRFNTQKGKVLVVQTEVSVPMLANRLRSLVGDEDVSEYGESIIFYNERIKIDTNEGKSLLTNILSEVKPDLLILDPLYTLHNKNEDLSSDMAPLLTDLKSIVSSFDIACVLIHHQGKRSEKSNGSQPGHKHRGSSALADVPDASWSLEKTKEKDLLKLSFEMRNHEPLDTLKIKRGKNMTLEAIDEYVREINDVTSDDISKIVERVGAVTSGDLVDLIVDSYPIKERKARDEIKNAFELGKVKKKSIGKNSFYYTSEEQLHSCVTL